jgi:copper chaperone
LEAKTECGLTPLMPRMSALKSYSLFHGEPVMTATIRIKGMACSHCVAAVSNALGSIDGVTDVDVDLENGQATFKSVASVDMAKVRQEIEKAGYELG